MYGAAWMNLTYLERAFALAAAVLLAGCSASRPLAPIVDLPQPSAAQKPRHDCSVTLYGDSILHGVADSAGKVRLEEHPAEVIERLRPAYFVVDKTVPGDFVVYRSSEFLRDRIMTRLVVIEHGMNDASQRFDYAEPLRKMIRRIKTLGKTPIVTGLSRSQVGARDAYDAMARRIATEEGAIFADWGAVGMTPADLQDGLHPAQAYSRRLAEQLVKALDRATPECVTAQR
ncbi:hypothetical protein C7T35_14395 [Variovorax sp. WS11]|nr:hypothetical protein C7T35_14395 [Variovorax sp. WS11]